MNDKDATEGRMCLGELTTVSDAVSGIDAMV